MLILFFILAMDIPMDKVGIYEQLNAYKVPSGYLFISRSEHSLVLVKDDGTSIKYDKKGQGPNNLFAPTFLGLRDGIILILSNGNKVINFDQNLDLVKAACPDIPPKILKNKSIHYGFDIQNDQFFLLNSRGHQFLFSKIQLKHKKWKHLQDLYPQRLSRFPGPDFAKILSATPHESFVFVYHPNVIDEYTVHVYERSNIEKEEPIVVLQQTNDGLEVGPTLPNSAFQMMALGGMKIPGGYAVRFATRKPNAAPFKFTKHVDLFDEQGRFKQRIAEIEDQLVPVMNRAGEVMIIVERDGEERLEFWNPLN